MTTPPPLKTLADLLHDVPTRATSGDTSVAVSGIATDSRSVSPGDVFVALRGAAFDGHRFVADAIAKGAVAVVVEGLVDVGDTACAVVDDSHRALGLLSSAFYDHPSRKLRLIGVTGTDGKTSTTTMTAAILRAAGLRTGHWTTVEFHDGISARPNSEGFTTPPAPVLQRLLAEAVSAGAEAMVLEVSSHALVTERVAGCEFDVAVFTNLAPEHLDFHGSIEEYRAAKLRLFEMLREPRTKARTPTGVVNADDASADYFVAVAPNVVLVGLNSAGMSLRQAQGTLARSVTAHDVMLTPKGSSFMLDSWAGQALVHTYLLGRFNVRNWLAAAGAALAADATPEDVARAAAELRPVPGRMETLDAGQPFAVYVDFAHTPQGMAAALDTVRELHPDGRSIAVFGHAGGRDPHHRRDLVDVARTRCDLFILTMDDPYDEDPMLILETMRREALSMGCVDGDDFMCVLDRREAFERAFTLAKAGDVVLLAGRGHETSIPLGHEKLPFHDATVARELLEGRKG